jgi:hypothetical protein
MPLVTEERYWALFYMTLVSEERYWALFYVPLVTEERYWALFYVPLVTEERYWALFYMPLYTFIHILLNVLLTPWPESSSELYGTKRNVQLQIANKMGFQKKNVETSLGFSLVSLLNDSLTIFLCRLLNYHLLCLSLVSVPIFHVSNITCHCCT